ncbi:MAG: 4-(cytidine 5'-diphospho)-2-C-methyl-D-erythritol kinase [Clostridia bacterium]|nr:4-(cytidine 5'-diphospho)-2-C-methyl-D-erythritol kinase [Clostridia bacterium]
MKTVTLDAYAKINLFLDIVSKRDDGYHNIESVMQTVSLADKVTLMLADGEGKSIRQHFPGTSLPCDETNICYKSALAYFKYFGIENYSVDIKVTKNIPEAAGLAGGSADGAAVICALDMLYEKNTDIDTLCKIGLTVGSDIAFCIVGGTASVTGRGEYVKELAPLSEAGLYCVVAKSTKEAVSTREAYAKIDAGKRKNEPQISFEKYVGAIENRDTNAIGKGFYNIFEDVMSDSLKDTFEIKRMLKRNGALAAQMSGSGPSVFGLFERKADAESACHALEKDYFARVCELK